MENPTEAQRLQLQQTVEWIRHLLGYFVQAAGFFIAADALLLGYGIGQKKAVFLLFACFSVIGMAVALWLFIDITIPASCVAIHLERELLGKDAIGLINLVLLSRSVAVYERLVRFDEARTNPERKALMRGALPLWDFVKGPSLLALLAMLAAQTVFFVVSLTALHYSFA